MHWLGIYWNNYLPPLMWIIVKYPWHKFPWPIPWTLTTIYKSSFHTQLPPLLWRRPAIFTQNVCSTLLSVLLQHNVSDHNSMKHWNVIHIVFFSCQVRFTKAAVSEGHRTGVEAVPRTAGNMISSPIELYYNLKHVLISNNLCISGFWMGIVWPILLFWDLKDSIVLSGLTGLLSVTRYRPSTQTNWTISKKFPLDVFTRKS